MRARRVRALVLAFTISTVAPSVIAQSLERAERVALAPVSSAHFDQVFRESAFEAWRRGSFEWAFRHFVTAARYGDKPSQLAIANLYASGEGVGRDLALAYAWADVASERGFPKFVARREQLWEQLDAAQRELALAEGARLYAEFGDAVAKARHQSQLDRAALRSLGRRPSLFGSVRAYTAACGTLLDPSRDPGSGTCFDANFFDDENWESEAYWRVQDALWGGSGGTVEVAPVRKAEERAPQR